MAPLLPDVPASPGIGSGEVGPAPAWSKTATHMEETTMGLLGTNEFNDLNDLFVQQLEDLYDAEKRLTDALPKMAEAAHSPDLKNAFRTHYRQTQTHVSRLEQVFGMI